MKKTLVALAVLAASGASMAQVTMTGTFNFGVIAITAGKASATGTTVSSSGLGVHTSEVYLNVKEDLGGGMGLSLRYGFGG
ncbi:porin, partial [Propionivibrio sp.]|uniref:porin n=1 Tax=Propionivibrio sp. TaxID=2212460 RepID=UPI003BF2ADE3